MRAMLFAVVAVFTGIATGSAAPLPKPLPPKSPAELLVGSWELVSSTTPLPPGLVVSMEFTVGGVLDTTITRNGTLSGQSRSGKYKLADGKLTVEYTAPNRQGPAESMNVKEVTAEKLILVADKETLELKRVKSAK